MAHLQLILASDSPAAMLIKFGPGQCSCTVGWDRREDIISHGQCLRHRLECPDISPDGQYFSYYVDTRNPDRDHRVYRAISRSPWLKAETFWSSESGMPGVALFLRGIGSRPKIFALCPKLKPEWDHLNVEVVGSRPHSWSAFVDGSISFLKWQRDGWRSLTSWERCGPEVSAGIADWRSPNQKNHRIVFEKILPHGWKLQLTHWCGINHDDDRGVSFETFALVSPQGAVERQNGWVSSDYDAYRKRVVWAFDNMLFGATIERNGLGEPVLLWDARGLKFSAIKAPY